MSTFEYKVIKTERHVEILPLRTVEWDSAEALLDHMPQDGWELVSVVAYPDLANGMSQWKEFYFKRPVSLN